MRPRPQLWLESYAEAFPIHYIPAWVATSLFVYGVGAGASWLIGFQTDYVRSPPIYFGLFGIFWLASCGIWASRRLHCMLSEIRPAFLIQDDEFQRFILCWLGHLYNRWLHLGGGILLILFSWLYVVLDTRLGKIAGFSASWSEGPDLWVKNLILGLYAAPIGLLLFTMGVAILTYAFFVWSVVSLPLVPLLDFGRQRLRPLAGFGLATGLAWSVGVSLFVLTFRLDFTPSVVVGILILTALGLVIVIWPTYAIHRALERTREKLYDVASHELTKELQGRGRYNFDGFAKLLLESRGQRFTNLVHTTALAKTWVYNPADVILYLVSLALPLAALVVGELSD